jgi:tetratricopeptide (TPR) repeat protein
MKSNPPMLGQLAGLVTRLTLERALAYQHQGNPEQAIAYFTEVIRESSSAKGYYFYLRSCCFLSTGDYDSAIADYDQALRLSYTGYGDCVIRDRDRAVSMKEGRP